MSLFLSKVLSLLIHPLFLGLLLLGTGGILAYWWTRWGLGVGGLGLLILWGASMPVVAHWGQASLEARYPPRPVTEAPAADAIVVLGGAVGAPIPPRVYPDLGGAADRVWHAARLYEAGNAPLVVASGGTLPWNEQAFREAPIMKRLLTDWGVPADSVLTESNSANTYQNAVNTAALLEAEGLDRVLLVTSALHMRRALATFRSAGVEALPAATDYRAVEGTTTLLDWLPSVGALQGSTATIREYVGYTVYWWRGWIGGTAGEEAKEAPASARHGISPSGSRSSLFAAAVNR